MSRISIPIVILLALATNYARADKPINIGSRLELFVDDYLIGKRSGDVKQHLHKPTPREVALVTDKPWEGNTCAYYTIFQDGDIYRMYYRGSHWDEKTKKAAHSEVTCYAESKDGIHWTKPNLGLFEFDGSKDNNIVWDGIGTHCFVAFKDGNPKCKTEARYKGISAGSSRGKRGLFVFQSSDGIHWKLIRNEPVITEGAFDSQNLAFWDPHAKLYREYHRTFVGGVRAIMTGTSTDFVNWTKPKLLDLQDSPKQHLYTNAVRCYDRAPHILLGFPTRYLPGENSRVEPTFMTSRDGSTFHRWLDAVIPEDAPKDRGGNRSNYMTWGLLKLPSSDKELSVYATEAYYTGPDSRVRRFTYRVDGFVSVRGGAEGGELLTKPIEFVGNQLLVNYAAKSGGKLRVEIHDAAGKAIDGFSLADCTPLTGDSIEQPVTWKGGNLKLLTGKPVTLRFELTNADLFSMGFQ